MLGIPWLGIASLGIPWLGIASLGIPWLSIASLGIRSVLSWIHNKKFRVGYSRRWAFPPLGIPDVGYSVREPEAVIWIKFTETVLIHGPH